MIPTGPSSGGSGSRLSLALAAARGAGVWPCQGGSGRSTGCPQPLCGRLAEHAPGVEAAGEGPGLVAFPHQPQLAGVCGVLGAHVLDVHLGQSIQGWDSPAQSSAPPRSGPRGEKKVPKSSPTQSQHGGRSYLARLEAQLDLHLAGLGAHPHVDLQKGSAAGLSPQSHQKIWAQESLMPQLTSRPLSSSMMSSSARSSWQKSEHFSDTEK